MKPILKIALVDDEQEYLDGMGKLCNSFGRSARYPGSPVSYTHLRAHETSLHLVCRLLLEKKKKHKNHVIIIMCA